MQVYKFKIISINYLARSTLSSLSKIWIDKAMLENNREKYVNILRKVSKEKYETHYEMKN